MSTKSSTPVVAYPYEMAEIELKELLIEATDKLSVLLPHYSSEWKSTGDETPRIDLRNKYEQYADDELYSDINELKITVMFEINTKDCIKPGGEFNCGIHLSSRMSKYEKYVILDNEVTTSTIKSKTVEMSLSKEEVQKLKGNILISPFLCLVSDDLGTVPVKVGTAVLATSKGSILSTRESTNQFTILFDDPAPPTSSGMEIVWLPMDKNALFALSYPHVSDTETPIGIRLVLNEKSHLVSLKNGNWTTGSGKKALEDLIFNQIVSQIQTQLITDLVRFFGDEMRECVNGTRECQTLSALEYAMDVLHKISETIGYSPTEVLTILIDDKEKIETIALKIQNSKKLGSLLTALYNAVEGGI